MRTNIPPVVLVCELESQWTPLFRRGLARFSMDAVQQAGIPAFPLDSKVCAVGISVSERNVEQAWVWVQRSWTEVPQIAVAVLGDRTAVLPLCEAGICLPVSGALEVPGACRYLARSTQRKERNRRSESLVPIVILPWHAATTK